MNPHMGLPAQSWEEIVWEAERAIGTADAAVWLASIQDIVTDPYFMPWTVPCVRQLTEKMQQHSVHVTGRHWVTPHAAAYRALGKFQIWYESQLVTEMADESQVRIALLENRLKMAKL
jgi:hypothetical protein